MHADTDDEVQVGPTSSLSTTAYELIRSDLLAGHFRPNEKLATETIRKRLNIGNSPIREALNRLLSEGLVELEDQKGFRVAPVSKKELRELVAARCWIDGAAIIESIRRFDPRWEEQLILSLYRLSRSARAQITRSAKHDPEWERLHREFHGALVGGCDSRFMRRTSEQLFDLAERYRILAADSVPERNELEEHQAIADACLTRRADDAVALLKGHYGKTYEVICSYLDKPVAD